jgi:hypothetical protein
MIELIDIVLASIMIGLWMLFGLLPYILVGGGDR